MYKKINELLSKNSTTKSKITNNLSSTFPSWSNKVTTSRSKREDMSKFKDRTKL
jgi:hypothetical protein